MKLILIRHGETEWNKQRRIQGCRSDTRLSQKGLEEADRLAAALRNERVDAIYSSPLKRAAETAQIISDACKVKVQLVNELREIDAGALDGLFETELTGTYETAWRELGSGDASISLPGGESLLDVAKRTSWAIDRLLERHADGTVLVVAHLLVNLVMVCQLLGTDLSRVSHLRLAPASITILELTTQGNSLLLLNDTCHLQH
ncbi:MAG: histidine phosphatase family protein [Dehalococcoidia bacterium]|nr:histidine phosphatase family protein [Dehalococcoidia bacterium]